MEITGWKPSDGFRLYMIDTIVRLLEISLVLFIAFAAVHFLVLKLCVRGILRSYRRSPDRIKQEFGFSHPKDFNLDYEDLIVEVEPGISVSGWLIRAQSARRGVLVYHHGIWDAGSPRLPLAERMTPKGFDCVLYDSRGQGRSGGRYCTFGEREKFDLIKILDAVDAKGVDTSHVAVVGHSMGAATAVYAAGIDSRIKALVLEACYRDLPTAVHDYARLLVPVLTRSMVDKALVRAGQIGEFEPADLSPIKLMPGLTIPVLFVQGTADQRIKPQYAEEHFDAKPDPKELHFIEGARHGRLWHEGGIDYLNKLEGWLCSNMPELITQ